MYHFRRGVTSLEHFEAKQQEIQAWTGPAAVTGHPSPPGRVIGFQRQDGGSAHVNTWSANLRSGNGSENGLDGRRKPRCLCRVEGYLRRQEDVAEAGGQTAWPSRVDPPATTLRSRKCHCLRPNGISLDEGD
jgi:hypothetical protein